MVVEEPNRVECLFLEWPARRNPIGRNPPFGRKGRARIYSHPNGCSAIHPPAGGDLKVLAELRILGRAQHLDRHARQEWSLEVWWILVLSVREGPAPWLAS